MNPTPHDLDVSPEEEAFLHATFRRHARSYLAISVFALGLAVAGLGFGLRNATAASRHAAPVDRSEHFAEQRAELEAMRLEVADQIAASSALTERLAALEAKLEGIETQPDGKALDAKLAEASRRLRALEKKQGITTTPVSTSVYKRLNELEARLSVVELERG